MKLLNKMKSLIYKNKNKEDLVLIKSKFGLPSMRVCGAVLVDGGEGGPCTQLLCSNDGSCPCDGTYNENCPTNNPFCPVGDSSQCPTLAVGVAFIDPNLLKEQNSEENINIFFAGNSIDFKEATIILNGVDNVIFGKANLNGFDIECTCVQFNLNLVSPVTLVKIYYFMPIKDKKILCDSPEQLKKYKDLLSSIKIELPVVRFTNFEF